MHYCDVKMCSKLLVSHTTFDALLIQLQCPDAVGWVAFGL